jgi:hypothetical protein
MGIFSMHVSLLQVLLFPIVSSAAVRAFMISPPRPPPLISSSVLAICRSCSVRLCVAASRLHTCSVVRFSASTPFLNFFSSFWVKVQLSRLFTADVTFTFVLCLIHFQRPSRRSLRLRRRLQVVYRLFHCGSVSVVVLCVLSATV